MLYCKLFCLGAAHGSGEGLAGFSGFADGWRGPYFGSLGVAGVSRADDMKVGGAPGAGECGVGPFASELFGAADDDGGFGGCALAGVAGDGVGVLEMRGGVGGVEQAAGAVVEAHLDAGTVACDRG